MEVVKTNKTKTGEILCSLRKEKGVSQEQLCAGLCTQGVYSKYEYEVQSPDWLLMQVFLQRLGKAADKLTTVLGQAEYNYFLWRREVLTVVGREDMDELRRLLNKPQAVEIVINQKLQQQFVCRIQAVLADGQEQDIKKSIQYLIEAAELTMPGIFSRQMDEYLISVEEMHILLELSRELIKGEREKEAIELLTHISEYAERHYDDYEAKVKVYPRASKLLWPLLKQADRELEGMLVCKKAVELLCWQGILYDLAELLEGYLICGRKMLRTEETIRYERQLKALQEVYQEYGAEQYGLNDTGLFYYNQEMYLIGEIIKEYRVKKCISQDELSEEICTPETLSRIENGKRVPSRKNFYLLMDKLGTEHDYYNGGLDTDEFLLLEKQKALERAMTLKNWVEARELLEYLKSKADMRKPLNRQVLQVFESCILFNEGNMGTKDFLKVCEQALGCEHEDWKKEKFWNRFFTRQKVSLLNYIALIYERDGRQKETIFILEHLLEWLNNSKIRLADRYVSSMTIVGNLSSLYGITGRLEECLESCKKGICLCLESGRGTRLGKFLVNQAEAMNDKMKCSTEESRKYLQQAFYLSDLMSTNSTSAYIDTYYREHYEPDMKWY